MSSVYWVMATAAVTVWAVSSKPKEIPVWSPVSRKSRTASKVSGRPAAKSTVEVTAPETGSWL